MILGMWEDQSGRRYIFDGSGTCSLAGENLYFTIDGTDMSTGKDIAAMTQTHTLGGVTKNNAWLHDMRSGTKVSIYLTRVAE